ncbi:hypothetical protein NC652_030745 [Populus alba x Populus x berolinensis]|uniref:NB-ARC domain-containing disease resistance protein n=1 Tax=Populus tomentosa TaxID=118781 RepID=A0A8X7YJ15_POPTO|nr:hypothetical protein POTOM_043858 [Populus tomentosa]KAJ6883601.1 hypothetical protein NC652_030745 [Populus alba x Populus x berolinensis]
MAVDIILSAVSPFVEHAIGSIKTNICNAFYCKSNLRHLKEEVDKLKNARERMQHLVDEDRRKGKVIEEDVAKWLLEVDGITEKVERELAQDEGGVKKKCFMGLCPNFKTRYQFGKKAEEKLATVKAKLEEQRSFVSISYHVAPSGVEIVSGKGYQAMQSRIPVFNEIMNALKTADVNIVGVYGMGGVGKTTLVKEVSKQAIEDKLFDKMVIASVTRNPDIMKIQGQIADQLGLTFNEESEWGRAGRLRERLKQEKKILVVLDDLWKRLDLEAIGISFKDEQNECKMLLTSREFDVLSSEMEVEKNFSISGLKEDEAWELFKKTAGGNVESPDVQFIALKIATKCAGLPLAIVTVAKALKDKRLPEWKNALRELKRPSPRNFTGLQAEVYSAIELSYKHLGSEELKAIFLLSSRMGYNASIQDLLKYSMGSGLFSDVATIEEVRDKVNSLLHKLKTSSLLLDGDTSKQFSVHDVVRDVAISIAFRDHNVFFRSDEVELKWQYKDSLESHAEIWLHGNSFGLPEDLQYPLLKVLNMNSEDSSLEVPENIFKGMQKLKVLGLTNLSFPAPHSSLQFLKNLRSLCLHQSSLGEIAIIGELKKLEILSFVKSNIKHLPKEIGQLTKLKLLDLSDCSELEVISPNVISNLSLLEELFVGNSFHHWDIEGHNNASLIELEHLSHLTNLDVHMLDSHVMSIDLFSRKLERFRIFIGDVWDWDGAYETLRTLKLKLNESTDHLKHGVLMLLKRTEDLYLLEMKGIKNVICELDSEGFPQLKYLHLHNSPDIQYIIDTMKGVPANILPFPMLESLFLYNLVSLEKIYHGTLKTPSFGKLQMLEVKHCNKLKNLFSFSIARGLLLLQSIKITCCRNLEEIVVEESEEFDNKNEEINSMELTQVRSLSLKYLPNLRNFCSKEKASCLYQTQSKSRTTGMDFGEIILEDEPHAPMQLFDEKFVFPNLEDLKLHSINIERLWHGQLPAITVSIQNLQRLVVKKCGSLKYIFSSSMVKSLVQLKHLAIHDCMSVEEIIVTEELDEEERTSKMVFLKLEHIELSSLPKLKHFCIGSHIECPLLKRLVIDWCHDFQTFVSEFSSTNLTTRNGAREVNLEENFYNAMQPLFDEKVVFPCLAEIQISHIDKIWHNQLAAGSFCELRSMSISDCDKLVNIFPSTLLTRFQRLEMLEISHCHSLETIFELQGLGGEEIQASNAFQLQDLDLYNLPRLKHIWNKDPQGRLIFQNLHSVRVGKCSALKNLFPVSIARDLPQLEKLEIKECGVEEIVANAEGDETAPRFDFPHLTSLTLEKIPEFRNFYPGKHSWECPILKSLEVSGCGNVKLFGSESHTSQEIQRGGQQDQIQQPLFFVEKVISTLEELSLSGENPTTSIIWCCQLPEKYYSAVKLLRLHYFQEESDTIPFGFIQILCNLETLYVTRSSFKRLFSYEGLTDVNQKHRMLGRLRNFKIISSFGDMRHMWKDNDQLVQFLQNLGTLEVILCHSLVNLAPSSASFENLTILDVRCCFGLLNLITSSTAKSLVQLVKLTVRSCKKVMEIVAKERDETEDEIIFSKLEYLELVKLESLTSFCPGNHTFKFPSLKEIVVRQCPKMRIFSPRVVSTPKLQGVCFAKNKVWWQGNLNNTIQQLYTEMVGFGNIWELKLSDFPQLKERWHDQLPFNFCRILANLTVDDCAFVSNAIPSNLLQFMNNLRHLYVRNCRSLKVVFDLEGLNAEEGHAKLLPNLKELQLIDLPGLRDICSRDPQGILDFKNLKSLKVHNCSSLRDLFTPSMASGLVQLHKIEIRNCTMMEKIITEERVEEAATYRIIFPVLKVIVLESLHSMTSIDSGTGILGIPSLEEIGIDNCPNLKPFISSFLSEHVPVSVNKGQEYRLCERDHDISTAPFLNHKVAFPNMKKLRVEWNDVMEVIQNGQFRVEYFYKLEGLTLMRFPCDKVDFPSHFLQRFINLKNLVVRDASFEEIVFYEGEDDEENHIRVLAQLKKLELSKLPKLMRLSKEGSQTCKIFRNLETLRVLECGMLKILIPSALSFQCLTTLEVSNCHGLINLMTSSTAKYLVQLTSMSVTECKMIEEIIVSEENEVANEIFFQKLEHLSLRCLPSLTSFHSGKCAFTFPSLEEVFLIECPNMKKFSEGIISTPELETVLLTEEDDEGYWEEDLNSTVQKLFVEMDDGAAQSELLSIPKQSTLACEAKADGKAPSAVSERRASEDLHLTGTSEARKDISPVFETLPRFKQNRIKGVLLEPKIAQLASRYQDFHAASNDKDSRQGQSSSTPMDSKAQISLQEQTDSQAPDNDETSLANAIPTISVQQSYRVLVSRATSVEQVSMLTSTSLTNRTSSQELTFDTASSSNTPSGYLMSCGVSFEIYRCSIDLLKELLMKSPAEVATSADRLLLLSSLKNLKNCPFLNYQQQKIIQLYAENFDTLVTSHPFDAQKIDWTSSIESSIEDHKRRLAELDISDEDMTSKISRLKAEKDALNKRLQEIQEEEDHFLRNKERLHAQRIIRNGRLEIQIGALLEAQRHERETKGRASHVNENWAKFRSLFA